MSHSESNQTRVQGLVFAAVTALLWSFLAIALKYALLFCDAYTIVWFRFFIAFLFLGGFFALFKPSRFRIFKSLPILALLAGVFLAANYIGYMKGVEYLSASAAQVLIQTAPLLLAVIGIFYFKEKTHWIQRFGFAVSILGLYLFYQDQINVTLLEVGDQNFIAGILFLAFAVVTWALWGTLHKILIKKWLPQEINLLIYCVAAILFIPAVKFEALVEMSLFHWGVMIFLGINTIIAYGSLAEALKRAPANQVSMIITVNPLFTLIFVYFLEYFQVKWFKPEPISLAGYIGAMALVSGVILVVGGKPRKAIQVKSV